MMKYENHQFAMAWITIIIINFSLIIILKSPILYFKLIN